MSKTAKNTYKIIARNEQGASTRVAPGSEFTSVAAAAEAARAEMGSGWNIAIVDRYGEVVRSFTIR